MKASELRQKSSDEMDKEILEQLKAQLNLRMLKATGQAQQTHQFKQIRRDIARIKTVLKEMESGKAS
jgi:large subunit ribosomal protein L29